MIVPALTGKFDRTKINSVIIIALAFFYCGMAFATGKLFLFLAIITGAMQCMMAGLIDGPVLGKVPDTQKGGFSGFRFFLVNIGSGMGTFMAGIFMINSAGLAEIYLIVSLLMVLQLLLFVFGFKEMFKSA